MGSAAIGIHLLVLLLGPVQQLPLQYSVFSNPFSIKLWYLLSSSNIRFFSHVFWKMWTKGMIGNTLGSSIAGEKVMHSSCYLPFPVKIKSLTWQHFGGIDGFCLVYERHLFLEKYWKELKTWQHLGIVQNTMRMLSKKRFILDCLDVVLRNMV